jgi:elongation factor P--beta-lysine ligase
MDNITVQELKMEIFQSEFMLELKEKIEKWRLKQGPEMVVKQITQSSSQHFTTICIWYTGEN